MLRYKDRVETITAQAILEKAGLRGLAYLHPIDFYTPGELIDDREVIVIAFLRDTSENASFVFKTLVTFEMDEPVELGVLSVCRVPRDTRSMNTLTRALSCRYCYIGNSVKDKRSETINSFLGLSPEHVAKIYHEQRLLLALIRPGNDIEEKDVLQLLSDEWQDKYMEWKEKDEQGRDEYLQELEQQLAMFEGLMNTALYNTSNECFTYKEENYRKRCNGEKDPKMLLFFKTIMRGSWLDFLKHAFENMDVEELKRHAETCTDVNGYIDAEFDLR